MDIISSRTGLGKMSEVFDNGWRGPSLQRDMTDEEKATLLLNATRARISFLLQYGA